MCQPNANLEEINKGKSGRAWGLPLAIFAVLILPFLLFFPTIIQAQELPISTPDADGHIYVVVQPNDSLWGIAARAGLTLDALLELNGLQENAVVQPGDLILVAIVIPPATPTSDIPTATLPPPLPTATTIPLRTAVCFLAYDDIDRNGQYDPAEPLWPGVAFTLFNEQEVVANYITDGLSEPYCLENLASGTYHVTRSIARDEILTTEGDWAMTVMAGSVLNLAFGSYREGFAAGEETPDADEQLATRVALTPMATPTEIVPEETSALDDLPVIVVVLAVLSFVLLLGVAVLILWIAIMRLNKSKTVVENEDEDNN